MSETITYTSLTTLVNALSTEASTAEAIIMQAINKICLHGYAITQLSGDEGYRTGSYTQAEAGAILEVAVLIYSQYYVASGASSSSINLGQASMSQSSSSTRGAGAVDDLAKQVAAQLKGHSFVKV